MSLKSLQPELFTFCRLSEKNLSWSWNGKVYLVTLHYIIYKVVMLGLNGC